MAVNKEFFNKDLKSKLTSEEKRTIRRCDNCAIGRVVVYICPEHLEMVEK